MSALTDLQDAVTAETTVNQSAITLLNGIAAQIAASTDPAMQALATQITANASALSAAVVANTPAAPGPVVGAHKRP